MKRRDLFVPAGLLGATSIVFAQASSQPASQAGSQPGPQTGAAAGKVGIIHIQNAIFSTKDGQKALKELEAKFTPKKNELGKKESEIAQLRDQLSRGSNTMSNEAKEKLMREIDQKTKSLNRETQDAQDELDQENQKIMQDLGQKIMTVLIKYATDHGFSLVLDVSPQTTPVLWASNNIDITSDIISLYDRNAPASGVTEIKPAPPPGVTRPVTPPISTPSGITKPPAVTPKKPGQK